MNLFCSTGLPLARTKWVWSTFSTPCPLSSNQGGWLTSATSIIFPMIFFGNVGNQTPGLLGEKQGWYLCAAPLLLEIYEMEILRWLKIWTRAFQLKSRFSGFEPSASGILRSPRNSNLIDFSPIVTNCRSLYSSSSTVLQLNHKRMTTKIRMQVESEALN